jgi:hypothetical protein
MKPTDVCTARGVLLFYHPIFSKFLNVFDKTGILKNSAVCVWQTDYKNGFQRHEFGQGEDKKIDVIYWTGNSFQSSERRTQGRNAWPKSDKLIDSSTNRKGKKSFCPLRHRIWASDIPIFWRYSRNLFDQGKLFRCWISKRFILSISQAEFEKLTFSK